MKKETWARGVQIINAVMTEKGQINTPDTIEVYYQLLKDIDDKDFIEAVTLLMKEKTNIYIPPAPADIRNYVKKVRNVNSKAREIFEYIKRDIILFGKNCPKYKKRILRALDSIGGWNKVRQSTEEELKKLEESFIKFYEEDFEITDSSLLEKKEQIFLEQ